MANGHSMATAFMALLGIAPWAIYLGGLAKLTDFLTGYKWSHFRKEIYIMLDWYIMSAQLVNIVVVAVIGFRGSLHRAHSLLNMFLAVNAALLILQATKSVLQINSISAREPVDDMSKQLIALKGNPLPYLRVLAAGQIATATWNFFLAILVGYTGTEPRPQFEDGHKYNTF